VVGRALVERLDGIGTLGLSTATSRGRRKTHGAPA
jgi:hypothetical protein